MNPFENVDFGKSKPITREEFEAFIKSASAPAKLPREPMIIVHPKDLEAVKRFFGAGK
jgi:hypothetical protein